MPDLDQDGAQVVRRFRRMKVFVASLVIAGLAVQSFWNPWLARRGLSVNAVVLAQLAGLLFQVLACVLYLRLKGRKAWLGLLGLLGPLAVVLIFFLDKQCHRCQGMQERGTRTCTRCGAPV